MTDSDFPARFVDASQVDPALLATFLDESFPESVADFLVKHAEWLHRGNVNRHLVMKGHEIAGYSAVIPSPTWIGDRVFPAVWWVNLIIREKFRGQKLQRFLDEAARKSAPLQLGVPNEVAKLVHKKHGWGVRDDYHVLMLPLRPFAVPLLKELEGPKGVAARAAGRLATPLSLLYNLALLGQPTPSAFRIADPQPEALAAVFEKYRVGWVTTNRDADYIRWRFFDSPFKAEMTFYGAGESEHNPSVMAISRTFRREGTKITRVLDVFGDLKSTDYLRQALRLLVQDAIRAGAVQVTSVATNPQMMSALRGLGFLLRTPFNFCWVSPDSDVMQVIEKSPCHWTYADSDNDSVS